MPVIFNRQGGVVMRFVEQQNDWDLIIPFKADCFVKGDCKGDRYTQEMNKFLFNFQTSGDCEVVPDYCFASSKNKYKVYYPFKYNEKVIFYIEFEVDCNFQIVFSLKSFKKCLTQMTGKAVVDMLLTLDPKYLDDNEFIFFSLDYRNTSPCYYFSQFPELLARVTRLHIANKIADDRWNVDDLVVKAEYNGEFHAVGITKDYNAYETNPLVTLKFEDLGVWSELNGLEQEFSDEEALNLLWDFYSDGMRTGDLISKLSLIIPDNQFFFAGLLDDISVKMLNTIAPSGWTFVESKNSQVTIEFGIGGE